MKRCNHCGVEKPKLKFSRDNSKKDNLKTKCKKCISKKDREYYDSGNKKKSSLDFSKEEISDINSKQYEKHKAKRIKKSREYREKNPELLKERRQNQTVKENARISSSKRRALKLSTEDGTINRDSLKELRELQNNRCYYCNCELDFKAKNMVHLDHHFPLSKGGTHSITNVKYTCNNCNLTKNDTQPASLLLIFGETL